MSVRTTVSAIILFLSTGLYAQVNDDFEDGDFTNDVTWSGDVADFDVDAGRLHLNVPSLTSESYLSTPNVLISQTTWEFKVELGFNTTSGNQLFVYLVSDNAVLTGSVNGYLVRLGNTADEISLYRQSGTTLTKIIDGADGILNMSSSTVRVKVTRDAAGNWDLLRDETGGTNYVSEGTIFDATYIASSFFGFRCDYTTSNSQKFWMDDVHVYKPLDVLKIVGARDTLVSVKLNQYVEYATINSENFLVIDKFGKVLTKDVKRDSNLLDSINITLVDPLVTDNYFYQFSNLSDSLTSEVSPQIQGSFSYLKISQPELSTPNSSQIILNFDAVLNEYNALYSAQYIVDQGIGEPQNVYLDPVNKSRLTLNFDTEFSEGVDYEIRATGVLSIEQTANYSGAISFQYIIPLVIKNVEVLSESEILLSFNKQLDPISSEDVVNYIFDLDLGNPASATLQNDSQSVLLSLSVPLENENYTISISDLSDTFGNAISNLGNTFSFSYLPLEMAGISQVNTSTLRLGFNQKVERISAETLTNYVIFISNPAQVLLEDSDSTVLLTFPNLANSTYQLEVFGIENAIQNSTLAGDIFFDFERQTPQRDIVITEIMADPTPTIGQPDAEYLEVYNRSSNHINLRNFTLNGVLLPAYTIEPQAYLLIANTANYTNYFSTLTNAIGQSGFDPLTNAGDVVVLRDQFGNEVDSLFFNLNWYDDQIKDDGGYSLELINPELACSGDNNWTASANSSGGTPGFQNSVYSISPDVIGPKIISLEVPDPRTIALLFDEPLDENSIIPASFNLPDFVIADAILNSPEEVQISLNQDLISETYNVLELSGVKDCSGNSTQNSSFGFYYDITPPQYQEYVILSDNEIALKFNEPLNKTEAEREANFLLDGFAPSKALLQDSAIFRVHLQFENDFVENSTYMISIQNLKDETGNVSGMQQEPFTYVNEVDSIYVVAPNILALKLDKMPLISKGQNTSNYKIPSFGSPNQAVIDESDSTIIRLSFSSNFTANVSTKIYVENLIDKYFGEKLITPAISFIYDTRAPDLDSVVVLDEAHLKVVWTETINTQKANSANRYKLEDGETPTQVELLSNKSVILGFENDFEIEKTKSISVTGIPDLGGNVFASARKKDFVYDPKPPRLDKIIRSSDSTLRLTFHEKLWRDSIFIRSNFELDGINPLDASVQGPDSLETTLYFETISDNLNSTFTFKNIKDKKGNVANDSTLHLNTENPNFVELIALSDSTFRIVYSEAMDGSIEQLLNYETPNNMPISLMRMSSQIVDLEVEKHLLAGDTLAIKLSNIVDLAGNSLQQESTELIFDTFFESYKFIDDRTVELKYTTPIKAVSMTQFEMADKNPQLAILDGNDKKIVRLFFSNAIVGNEMFALSWSDLSDIYKRKIPDLSISVLNDKLPPDLVAIESDFFGVLLLKFSEPMDENAAESANLYSITNIGNPVSATYLSDSIVKLDFSNKLIAGRSYDLTIKNLPDVAGNFLTDFISSFSYSPPALPAFGEIIITEIMADPAPVLGLPEAEFIELFNRSSLEINLKALRLIDPSVSVDLPDYTLGSGEYVILTSNSNFSRFSIENKLGVTSFPSLGNTIDSLVLINIEGQLIDRVVYQLDWYGDADKDDGGYTLELINPESQCFGKANWTASTSELGGTPGLPNAVMNLDPDTQAPSIISYDIKSTNELVFHFNEPMDSLTLVSASYIVADLSKSAVSVSGTYFENVMISFEENFEAGKVYSLSISGPADCSGNMMSATTIEFGLGRTPEFNELLITEIMADPDPVVKDLPNAEYLEVYNPTDDLLSLAGVYLTDGADTAWFASQMLRSHQYLILSPTAVADDFGLIGAAMGLSNWPSLANAGEQLSLWHENELIFAIRYDQNWHDDNKSSGGYALEMKDVSNPCGGRLVWGSASSSNGGTPGMTNSNTASVPDNFGPELLSAFVIEPQLVRLTFSESLAPDAAQSVQISILPTVELNAVANDNLNRSELQISFSNELAINVPYEITITKVYDCNGNEIMQGQSIFVRPGVADSLSLIINEVLFDPKTGGVDFVEVYNNSDEYIDLKNWNLSRELDGQLDQIRIISEGEKIIPPHEYRALTSDSDELFIQYSGGKPENFIDMVSLPAYANDEGTVVLLDADLRVIDRFAYSDGYHSRLLKSVDGVSLERIDFNAPTQSPSNWASASSTVGFATPGYLNSQSFEAPQISGSLQIDPRVFVPGSASTANPSFTTINYQFEQAGKFANVMVYDMYGRPISELANGASLSTSGFLRWDGTDNTGKQVRSGYYLVVFEVFDGSGRKDILKETVVVGW